MGKKLLADPLLVRPLPARGLELGSHSARAERLRMGFSERNKRLWVEWGGAGLVKFLHDPTNLKKVIRFFASLGMTDADDHVMTYPCKYEIIMIINRIAALSPDEIRGYS
ncbi:hypothetical protein QE357_001136 [Siphonobacter sp. BAB-5404]|nr:hypothetical protein [Siphonobacter sp. SORGH_AS_0500]